MKFSSTYITPVKWAFLSACLLSLIHVVSALAVPTLTASIINEGVLQGDLDAISRLSVAMPGRRLFEFSHRLSCQPPHAPAIGTGPTGLFSIRFF